MRWFFLTRVGLATWVLSAALLLPEQASAQRLPQREGLALSAAIEEARRSPFHAHDGVNRSADAQFAARTDTFVTLSLHREPVRRSGHLTHGYCQGRWR